MEGIARKRKIGWLGWAGIVLGLALLAPVAFYFWARGAQSVAALDFVDSLFTGSRERDRIALGDDPAQQLFVYGKAAGARKPVLVFVHGGSWKRGDPGDYGFIARNFDDYVVVLAGYRLDRAGRFPAMLEDTAAAVAWVRRNIANHGGDPGRIVLMGHSAGAYNAAMVALDPQWLRREGFDTGIVGGMIGLAGPYDFYPFDSAGSRDAFGEWPRPAETQPVTFAHRLAPPMLLLTGTDDTVVRPRNSVAMGRALTGAGAPTRAVMLDGLDHAGVLATLARPFDRDRRVKDAVLAFLAERAESVPASAPVQQPGG